MICHLEKLFLFIASGTTSNLRKHFRESKEPAHQFEWIRLTELETKNSKPNITTPIKRIQVDDRTCKSESKGFKHPHPNPKYPIFLGLKFLNFNKPLIFIYLFYFIVKKRLLCLYIRHGDLSKTNNAQQRIVSYSFYFKIFENKSYFGIIYVENTEQCSCFKYFTTLRSINLLWNNAKKTHSNK